MDSINLASGDNNNSPKSKEPEDPVEDSQEKIEADAITSQMIEDNEARLKERIAKCKEIIESLKLDLNREKTKLEKETKVSEQSSISHNDLHQNVTHPHFVIDDLYSPTMYSACVDSKLSCDENLIEYEKQLLKFQNTLNMAQIEKKNAIRKQMLAKAYKLKLLEVENQCNIELLRVKQSLQCLEPLQMIANNWKITANDTYDFNSFELIPRLPELRINHGNETIKEDCDLNISPVKLCNKIE